MHISCPPTHAHAACVLSASMCSVTRRYCMSIHPRTDTPCTHLVVSGQRYLIFPELGECCRCCSSAGGCGILDPNWLDAAEYTGQVRLMCRIAVFDISLPPPPHTHTLPVFLLFPKRCFGPKLA
jgi:hypothetical protein